MYDAQAGSIKVEDIAANVNNRAMLERMRRNNDDDDNDDLWIQEVHDNNDLECIDYVPEGVNDMGWLGYFISKNDHLKELYLRPFMPPSGVSIAEVIEPFCMGVNHNRSIHKLSLGSMDLFGGKIFTMLGPFFENNNSLVNLTMHECHLGDDGWRLLALAIGSSTNKSLTEVILENNNISDEALVDIITALSMCPRLQHLDFDGNRLHKNGCKALSTLLQHSATKLQHLDLSNNEIDDEGIDALVPGLKTCSHLQKLRLCNTTSITNRGWRHLVSILETPTSNLKELNIYGSTIDNETLAAFANSLVNNRTLHRLNLSDNPPNLSITDEGWKVFSTLLCNTATVNSTFLSNHTLRAVHADITARTISSLLTFNKRKDKKEVAMIKILQNHDDFDMMPFFEWEFKVLPLMIKWFERASTIDVPSNIQPNIEPRKLSSIYQFVRGMPDLYVETRLMKELEDIKAEQSQMEEEFRRRKKFLQDRERSIMERLGPR